MIKQKLKKMIVAILISIITIACNTPLASAKVFLQLEDEGITNADTYILDYDDSASDYVKLQFGNTVDAYLRYDVVNDEFDINTDVNFNQVMLKNIVLDQGVTFPLSPVEGQKFYNTSDDTEYIYSNGEWVATGGSNSEATYSEYSQTGV